MTDHDQSREGLDRSASMDCERVLELVPTFVDEEASESQAGAIRQHLIDCAECRVVVQDGKGLRQWFEPLAGEAGRADVVVPEGFAARVTAMAVAATETHELANGSNLGLPEHAAGAASTTAGSYGSGPASSGSASPGSASRERHAPRLLRPVPSAPVDESVRTSESNSLGFLMGLTAAAAALMMTFTLMLAQDNHPDIGDGPLHADEADLDEILRELDEQNAMEIEAAKLKAALEQNDSDASQPGDAK